MRKKPAHFWEDPRFMGGERHYVEGMGGIVSGAKIFRYKRDGSLDIEESNALRMLYCHRVALPALMREDIVYYRVVKPNGGLIEIIYTTLPPPTLKEVLPGEMISFFFLSRYLGVSVDEVKRRVEKGKIEAVNDRIPLEDLPKLRI